MKQCAAPVNQAAIDGPGFEFCSLVAQHLDGTVITASSPANPGEQVVIYAFGLGKTLPAAPDGVAATGPSPVVVPVYLDLNFAPNAPPITVPAATTTYQPNYAGLTPGYAGLYQINLMLPSTIPSGVSACSLEIRHRHQSSPCHR